MTKLCVVCGKSFGKPPNCSMREWTEQRKCCSRACGVEIRRGRSNPKATYWKGKKRSPESRAKQSESLKRAHAEGRMHVIDNTGLRGEQTSQWKGDDISYRTAHARLHNERGRPEFCEVCGTAEGWLEWALRNNAEAVKVQAGGTGDGLSYSADPADYFGTCRRCHREYDGRERDPLTGRYI